MCLFVHGLTILRFAFCRCCLCCRITHHFCCLFINVQCFKFSSWQKCHRTRIPQRLLEKLTGLTLYLNANLFKNINAKGILSKYSHNVDVPTQSWCLFGFFPVCKSNQHQPPAWKQTLGSMTANVVTFMYCARVLSHVYFNS